MSSDDTLRDDHIDLRMGYVENYIGLRMGYVDDYIDSLFFLFVQTFILRMTI